MILKGKVKSGLGNASFWMKKVEKIFEYKTGIQVYLGTLNIELNKEYELKNYWIIPKEDYGGTQNVYVQECTILGNKSYIVRAEKTAHSSHILEIVSNINFRETYSLQDNDIVEIKI